MFSSLNARLWITYALLVGVALCVVAVGMLAFVLRNPLVDRLAYLNLERAAGELFSRPALLDTLAADPQQAVSRLAERGLAGAAAGTRLMVFSEAGVVLADSNGEAGGVFGPLARRILESERGVVRDQSGRAWLHVTRALPGGGYVLLALPRNGGVGLLSTLRVREILRDDLLPPFLQAGGLALLLALVLAYGVARWVAAPLQRMAAAAHQAAGGQYAPIPIEGPNEVRELAQAFNHMTARVQAGQQSQRDFLANVSHELKTPLTSIQGFSQAILDGAAEKPEELQQAARVIHDEAGRMHRLVQELLDLARYDAGGVELALTPLDLGALLEGIAGRFQPAAGQAGIRLVVQAAELPPVPADPDRLAQVLINLVDNALKFTPAGGLVELLARPAGGQAEILVRDSGPGIPAADLPRVFERFYQADKSRRSGRGGVGLGLPIAREIIRAHGGSLEVENLSPQGCVFMVKLPLARPDDTTRVQRSKRGA